MKLHLFEGIGIEIEYMIIENSTLSVCPVADKILTDIHGEVLCEMDMGRITYSNELVAHVVELKTTVPEGTLFGIDTLFHQEIKNINNTLSKNGCSLMGTAMHPFMNTKNETVLWKYGHDTIYKAFNRIFGCDGHGFSNIQSVHINLPFNGDKEFALLHTAIRLVLPLIPAIAASSPIADGIVTGFCDSRLEYYRNNQNKIPSIAGNIIPEAVISKEHYAKVISNKIYSDIKPYDTEKILQHEWLNSRGAIARFDRNSIEIRLIDTQESPRADLAISALVVSLVKALVAGGVVPFEDQLKWDEKRLKEILLSTIKSSGSAVIYDEEYLKMFGCNRISCTANELWKHIYDNIISHDETILYYKNEIKVILEYGSLSERIIRAIGSDISEHKIRSVYRDVIDLLAGNKQYV